MHSRQTPSSLCAPVSSCVNENQHQLLSSSIWDQSSSHVIQKINIFDKLPIARDVGLEHALGFLGLLIIYESTRQIT